MHRSVASSLAVATLMSSLGCSTAVQTSPRPITPKATTAAPATALNTEHGSVCAIIDDKSRVTDARIAERWPDKNYGSVKATFAGSVGNASRQTLLRFDLSSLPEDVRVTRATVSLHVSVPGGPGVTAHRVMAPWNEHEVTWSSFAQSYDSEPFTQIPTSDNEPITVSFDITDLAQAWAEGAQPNHGILLRQDNANTAYATSEAEDPSDRPRLLICYRQPDEAKPDQARKLPLGQALTLLAP